MLPPFVKWMRWKMLLRRSIQTMRTLEKKNTNEIMKWWSGADDWGVGGDGDEITTRLLIILPIIRFVYSLEISRIL